MFFTFIALCFSAESIEGGWNPIPVDSEDVKVVKPYLDTNVPHLFPEYENAKYTILSARLQIVSGKNIELTIGSSSTPLVFVITLYVDLNKIIQLKDVHKPIGAKPILGGYMWQNPSHLSKSDLANAVKLVQTNSGLIIQEDSQVLVYRTKNEKGLKTHIIFRDERNTICSAVFFKNFENKTEQFISAHQIY